MFWSSGNGWWHLQPANAYLLGEHFSLIKITRNSCFCVYWCSYGLQAFLLDFIVLHFCGHVLFVCSYKKQCFPILSRPICENWPNVINHEISVFNCYCAKWWSPCVSITHLIFQLNWLHYYVIIPSGIVGLSLWTMHSWLCHCQTSLYYTYVSVKHSFSHSNDFKL